MHRHLFAVLLGQLACAAARSLAVLEQTLQLPENWRYLGAARNDGEILTLDIALRQPRIGNELKDKLVEISTPGSPQFGHHFTREQLAAYQQPRPEAVDAVLGWLESSGVTETRSRGPWISFNATVAQTRTLLSANLGYYAYEGDRPVLRAKEYAVPADLLEHIDFIFPLAHFMGPVRSYVKPQPLRALSTDSRPNVVLDDYLQCSKGVQPECLKKLYQINYTAPAGGGPSPARFGIAGFLEQHINRTDVATFMGQYAADVPADYGFKVELVNNATNLEDDPGIEAVLDVQYGLALGYPTEVTYYITGGRGTKLDANGTEMPVARSDNEPYLEFLQHLLAKPDDQVPHVISISYADDEQSVPRAYAERVCDLFAQLAARGVSVLAATGDGGSRGTGQTQCLSNDGQRRRMTIPTFPASCPWVTAVGATDNEGPPVSGAFFSTGGFSNYFPRPAWQEAAAGAYIEGLDGSKEGMFNVTGRAIPDISAVGASFVIHWSGRPTSVQGTSASTPVVAAMVALVNDARLRAGKNATGWLNPRLYSAAMQGAIADVTEGTSQGCWWEGVGTVPGWSSTPGYDAVTGLGTPNTFEKFLAVLGD